MKLDGAAALITGGARIGAAVADALARHGVSVALTYRASRAAALNTLRTVRSHGVAAEAVRCDLRKDADARRAVAAVVKAFGRLDIVVNMASTYEATPFASLTAGEWEEALQSNLTSAHRVVLHAAPHLRRRGGRVVNVADWVAASGRPAYRNFLPYYTAKRGVIGLTEAQALELAPRVLVNAVAPGPIVPPAGLSKRAARAVAAATPLRRWGGADEIARAVLFLCETDFVTGECLRVDGGRHLL